MADSRKSEIGRILSRIDSEMFSTLQVNLTGPPSPTLSYSSLTLAVSSALPPPAVWYTPFMSCCARIFVSVLRLLSCFGFLELQRNRGIQNGIMMMVIAVILVASAVILIVITVDLMVFAVILMVITVDLMVFAVILKYKREVPNLKTIRSMAIQNK
jgi:hypothetical protein